MLRVIMNHYKFTWKRWPSYIHSLFLLTYSTKERKKRKKKKLIHLFKFGKFLDLLRHIYLKIMIYKIKNKIKKSLLRLSIRRHLDSITYVKGNSWKLMTIQEGYFFRPSIPYCKKHNVLCIFDKKCQISKHSCTKVHVISYKFSSK